MMKEIFVLNKKEKIQKDREEIFNSIQNNDWKWFLSFPELKLDFFCIDTRIRVLDKKNIFREPKEKEKKFLD